MTLKMTNSVYWTKRLQGTTDTNSHELTAKPYEGSYDNFRSLATSITCLRLFYTDD